MNKARTITAVQASIALEKGIEALNRSWAAEVRGLRYGSSITGDRERKTASNWEARADKHLDVVRAFIDRAAS